MQTYLSLLAMLILRFGIPILGTALLGMIMGRLADPGRSPS